MKVSGMPYQEARNMKDDKGQLLVQHPVACVDCHDPQTMAPRVTRPAFIAGIKALRAGQGIKDFDPNRDATRQEMRSFVCGQCHVEYYFKGEGKTVINRACQTCHAVAEKELEARVLTIQDRHHAMLQHAAKATTDLLDALIAAKKGGASESDLQPARALHRRAQWRLDFVAAENSMGFHAPQELARVLGEAIDYARQGQREAERTARKR